MLYFPPCFSSQLRFCLLGFGQIEGLLFPFRHLLVGLSGIFAVLLAHFAQLLILLDHHLPLSFQQFHLLFIVEQHLSRHVLWPIQGIGAAPHHDDLFLQLFYFFLQFLIWLAVVPCLAITFIFAWNTVRVLLLRVHQPFYQNCLACQLSFFIAVASIQFFDLFLKFRYFYQQILSRFFDPLTFIHCFSHKVHLVLKLDHSTIVKGIWFSLNFQLQIFNLLQKLRIYFFQSVTLFITLKITILAQIL